MEICGNDDGADGDEGYGLDGILRGEDVDDGSNEYVMDEKDEGESLYLYVEATS